MRFTRGSLARYFGVVLDARYLSFGVALMLSAAALGLASRGDSATAEEYSAYSDPDKTALSFILSNEQNVEEFQKEFALTDEEVEEALAAVREENETLSREYAESERIVEAGSTLPEEEVRQKIAASDYDEEVREAIAETKFGIEALVGRDRRSELKTWVDGQWTQEQVSARSAEPAVRGSGSGKTCRVWATYYRPNPGTPPYQVALPHKKLKFDGGFRVRITTNRGNRAWAPVKEVGPWNVRDNYWQIRRYRDMWDDLPRCVPEAQAAYFDNYNNGKDDQGRPVLNPAGFDITLPVARKLRIKAGIQYHGLIRLRVYYPWVRRSVRTAAPKHKELLVHP